MAIRHPGFGQPIWVRPGSTDPDVFTDVLLRGLYDCVDAGRDVRFILDAGANAGYSSLFFLARYPAAHVVAVEPESSNWRIASDNLVMFGDRVRVVHGALWPSRSRLRIVRSARADGHSVVPVGDGAEFDCIGIDPMTLLRDADAQRIGIFKCDIEGHETVLFESNPDAWLDRTDVLLIEIHSGEARAAVYPAMRRHGFRCHIHRELHAFVR